MIIWKSNKAFIMIIIKLCKQIVSPRSDWEVTRPFAWIYHLRYEFYLYKHKKLPQDKITVCYIQQSRLQM